MKTPEQVSCENDITRREFVKNSSVTMASTVVSPMIGAIGQMAVFTGNKVKWDEALNAGHVFGPGPEEISMDGTPPIQARPDGRYDVPVPGQYKLRA